MCNQQIVALLAAQAPGRSTTFPSMQPRVQRILAVTVKERMSYWLREQLGARYADYLEWKRQRAVDRAKAGQVKCRWED